MIPTFPEFAPLSFAQADAVRAELIAHGATLCEQSFETQFIWRSFDRPKVTRINGNLCIRIEPLNESPFFLEPFGTNAVEETARAMLGHTPRISRASTGFVERMGVRSCCIEPMRPHFDYLYRVSDLAELTGRRYDGKRNHVKRFERAHPEWTFQPLRGADAPEAVALFDGWCALKQSAAAGGQLPALAFSSQREALVATMEHFDALGLAGGALRSAGRMIGFIIGSRLNAETAAVHFRYCALGEQGAATMALREACRSTFAGYAFVNLEQDLGISGIRKNKQSYQPVALVEKFDVTAAGEGRR